MTRPHPLVTTALLLIAAALLWQFAERIIDLVRLCWWRVEHMHL